MKVVINTCFGGFGLSNKAIKRYLELEGKECYFYKKTKMKYSDGKDEYSLVDNNEHGMFVYCSTKYLGETTDKIDESYFYYNNISRTDKNLIKVVEELGREADGKFASLKIVEIPDEVEWEIDDYDGIETIHEVHRSWS